MSSTKHETWRRTLALGFRLIHGQASNQLSLAAVTDVTESFGDVVVAGLYIHSYIPPIPFPAVKEGVDDARRTGVYRKSECGQIYAHLVHSVPSEAPAHKAGG